ncbi:MAG TPA: hypothetical protein VF194_04895 [Ferrovibrio sp.]|uniref:hypothetical protein n=1 Tax=Ferrovibrio sp. TaxID=1917215 RepID=UPI002ECFFBA3
MYNKVEQEVILLNAVWKMIGGMVNYQLFVKGHGTEDVTLTFNTNVHARLFTILLVDFLSRSHPRHSRVPVIMISGLPAHHELAGEVDAFLQKPFRMARLTELLRELLADRVG